MEQRHEATRLDLSITIHDINFIGSRGYPDTDTRITIFFNKSEPRFQ